MLVESAPRFRRGAQLLGFAIGRTMRHHGHAVFHIITIDVAPEARRRGVGRRLMDWMVAKAVELGAQALRLEVSVDNTEALGFYAKFGFVQVGRIPAYYLDRIDALVLERKFSDA